jgi:hypothetical protein
VKHFQVKKLTYVAAAGTLVSVLMMSASLIFPSPLLLVFAMSVGQGIGILALSLFLLAIALDLNIGGALADNVEEEVDAIRDEQAHE